MSVPEVSMPADRVPASTTRAAEKNRCRPRVNFRRCPLLAAVCGLCAVPLLVPAARGQWGGGWGMNRGGYASTAGQAADYGMSEVLRARGRLNLDNSEAAKNWQDAKTQEIENKLRWTETYFEMRKVNRDARAAEEGPPVTQEQAIRMAKMAAPARLGSTQIDPVTGHISYPMILTQDTYAPYRSKLDQLFSERAASGSLRYDQFQAIQDTVSQFIDALKSNISKYAAGDYGVARTFLDSLAHEARMPAG
jgi:hypothetical protein